MSTSTLKLNPSLSITNFDTFENDKILVEVPAEKGKSNRYIIPNVLLPYLKLFDGQTPTSEVISKYTTNQEIQSSNQKFSKFINEYCLKNKILITKDELVTEAIKNKESSNYLKFKTSFVGAKHVNFFSKKLMLLYHFPISILLLSLCTAATSYYFLTENISQTSNFLQFGTYDSLIFLSIMALGLFCHELGHTTAAYLKGCRNMDIGAGFYIIFIVFYADLSETWRLKRKERVIIDIGGMYFQILMIGVLACINITASNFIIHSSLVALLISLLLNLNPFFRMDGYWLAVDYLDTPNLKKVARTKTAKYFSNLLDTNKRRYNEKPTQTNKKDKKINIYIVLSNLFIVAISIIFFDKLSAQLDTTIPSSFADLRNSFSYDLSVLNILDNTFSLMWQLVLTLFLIYFFYKLLKNLGAFFINQFKSSRNATN